MKTDLKNALAFIIIWICSGITMSAFRVDNYVLGITFTLLSSTSFIFMPHDKSNKNNN